MAEDHDTDDSGKESITNRTGEKDEIIDRQSVVEAPKTTATVASRPAVTPGGRTVAGDVETAHDRERE